MSGPENNSAVLKTNRLELQKTHTVLDGSGLATHFYEARANAAHGDPCLLTRYEYSAVAGQETLVTGTIEEVSTWDSSWDF